MTTLRQESNQPLQPARQASAAGAYLASAAIVLQARLGKDLWARLDDHTKSCLVTSQIFQEMLEEVWTQREKDYERTGKRTGEIAAPLIDFSPVVLCVFKALEIEIERKILRPFREALPGPLRDNVPETQSANSDLATLARFVVHGKPTPTLKVTSALLPMLRGLKARPTDLLGSLKQWMQRNLQRPNRWWRDETLCQRLQQAVDSYRNPAAHTGRLTPLEAHKAVEALWGKTPENGLVPAVLRAIEKLPSPAGDLARNQAAGAMPWNLGKDLSVQRLVLVKPRFWQVEAVDREMGDQYLVSVVPGDFEAAKLESEGFKARRQLTSEHLLRLSKWFQAESHWGQRVAIASQVDALCEPHIRRRSRAASAEDSLALALALCQATAALHQKGFAHGFISPHVVFRTHAGKWLLGGQALTLLAQRGCPVYSHPRTLAPEVNRLGPRTPTLAADVFAIAATVFLLRAGPGARNAPPPSPADVEKIFVSDPLRSALSAALAADAGARHADAGKLFSALCGQSAESAALASTRYRWLPGRFEELSALIDRDAPALEPVLQVARQALGRGFAEALALAFATGIRDVASAIYDAVRCTTRLTYDFEPSNPSEVQQEVRLARTVLEHEAATCLDLALLFAALLERAHLAPAILVAQRQTGWHAIGGFFDKAAEAAVAHVVTDSQVIRQLVSAGSVVPVETTGLCTNRGKKKAYVQARDDGVELVHGDQPLALINVMAGRNAGFRPVQ